MVLQIIWWIIVGLIIGALARLLVPGRDPMGWVATIVLGVAGSFLGGFIGNLIWPPPTGGSYIRPGGIFLSLIGAILLLLIWRRLRPA